jgi:hypothetical protein
MLFFYMQKHIVYGCTKILLGDISVAICHLYHWVPFGAGTKFLLFKLLDICDLINREMLQQDDD